MKSNFRANQMKLHQPAGLRRFTLSDGHPTVEPKIHVTSHRKPLFQVIFVLQKNKSVQKETTFGSKFRDNSYCSGEYRVAFVTTLRFLVILLPGFVSIMDDHRSTFDLSSAAPIPYETSKAYKV